MQNNRREGMEYESIEPLGLIKEIKLYLAEEDHLMVVSLAKKIQSSKAKLTNRAKAKGKIWHLTKKQTKQSETSKTTF